MLKNHKLVRVISEVSFAEFKTILEYKTKWHKRTIVVAPSNYVSSKLCSCCGYNNTEVKNLDLRNWICQNCKVKHYRDIDASKNLEKLIV